MLKLAQHYRDRLVSMLDAVVADEAGSMELAIAAICESLVRDGMVFVTGSGHSHMMAEEVFYRAGGIAAAQAILEPELMLHLGARRSSAAERKEGTAAEVLARYAIKQGDIVIAVSNSGRNAFPIECALIAKDRGATVIALTSLQTSRAITSRHSSGKLLKDVADIVLDNRAPVGDATLAVPGHGAAMAPASTITGAFILNTVMAEAVARAAESGKRLDVYQSANAPGQDGSAEKMAERWQARVIGL